MNRARLVAVLRRYGVMAVGLVGVGALVVIVNPAAVQQALAGADRAELALMIPVVLVLYAAHGLAWWLALRGSGMPVGLRRAVRTVFVSQAFDAVPGGDLWRVPILSADGQSPTAAGPLAATVVFDDLVYFFVLSVVMFPAAVSHTGLRVPLALALVPQVLIFVVLLWPAAYAILASRVTAIPILERYRPQLLVLGPSFRRLMHPRTLLPVLLVDAVCAILAVALYWLALLAVHASSVGIARAGFTYAATQVLSGLTVLPGAVGAYEAVTTALLALQGAPPAAAAAAALIYRAVNDVLMSVLGFAVGVGHQRRRAHMEPARDSGPV